MRPSRCRLLFLLLSLFLTGHLRADGGFRGKLTVAKPVEIPQQIAVLTHRDGRETLTVWNTVKAESQDLAWVLPLPAAPDRIHETHPGAVRMVQMICAPVVITGGDESTFLFKTAPSCLLVLLGYTLLLVRRRRVTAWLRALGMGILLLFLVQWFIGFTGTLMSGTRGLSQVVAGVKVLHEETAGNYETTVIQGDSAAAVNDWLGANGYSPYPAAELPVLADYLARKWVFLCARLKTTGTGAAQTHPLSVSFPVAAPVYPMRLTESAGTVPVDLYVIGDTCVRDPSGRMESRMTVNGGTRYFGGRHPLSLGRLLEYEALARAEKTPVGGLPVIPTGKDPFLDSLLEQREDGLRMTHLHGLFKPGSDWSDIALTAAPEPVPGRPVYTLGGFVEQVAVWHGLLAGSLVLGLGLLAQARTPLGERPHQHWPILTVWGLAAWLATGAFVLHRNGSILDSSQLSNSQEDSGSAHAMAWIKSLEPVP